MSEDSPLYVCWTTVTTREEAEQLARTLVERRAAACAQIDAPITSVYTWEGETRVEVEHRLWIKCPAASLEQAERILAERHPYETPQWLCLRADKVGRNYLKWALEVSNLRGFS